MFTKSNTYTTDEYINAILTIHTFCQKWFNYEHNNTEFQSTKEKLQTLLSISSTYNTITRLNSIIKLISPSNSDPVFVRLNNIAFRLELEIPPRIMRVIKQNFIDNWVKYNLMSKKETINLMNDNPTFFLVPFIQGTHYQKLLSGSGSSNSPGKARR